MPMKYDLLVYLALAATAIVIIVAAIVIMRTPESGDIETRKVRVAAVTLTGILVIFILTIILYFVDPTGAGKEIFDKAYTAVLTLAGTVIGYLFGTSKKTEGTTS
jgi:cytochrome bd-type quinol oxidase subunit 2